MLTRKNREDLQALEGQFLNGLATIRKMLQTEEDRGGVDTSPRPKGSSSKKPVPDQVLERQRSRRQQRFFKQT